MKNHILKAILLSSSTLLLLACGNDDTDSETIEEENTQELEEAEPSDEINEETEDESASDEEIEESANEDAEGEEEDPNIDNEENTSEPVLSELVYMSEEEQISHHENLAVRPQDLPEDAYDHLLLPGIHENTVIYEGRIAPGKTLTIIFPDSEQLADRTEITPEVSEDGYFIVALDEYQFETGQEIRFGVNDGENATQVFDVPVNEAQEGMEEIRITEDQ